MSITGDELEELKQAFSDLINYEVDDPEAPIDPLSYVQPDGDTCLHVAAHRGDLRAVMLLIKAGLDVNRQGDMGCTALHYATQGRHKEVSDYLLRHGASREVRNRFGKFPLDT